MSPSPQAPDDGGRRTAVVIGGGIGGVTAALALRRTGWQVTVLERTAEPADVGSGITLWPNALRALDVLGVGDVVRAAGARPPSAGGGLLTPDGSVLVDGSGLPALDDLYGFHRADLHRALRGQLPPGVLRTGAEVTSVAERGDGVVVELAGGETVTARVAVAADGLRSRIRTALWPAHPGLRYAGYTSWRGVTTTPVHVPAAGGETWGRGERFGMLPLRDGRVYWFAVANTPAGVRVPDAHAEVLRRFGGWHEPVRALVAATAPEAVLHLDIHDLHLPLPPFARGRVALLGDAAHAMTPNVGQGACQAIEDAVTLAAMLAGDDDEPGALTRYDAERRPRTASIVRVARRTGRVAQADGALAVRLRSRLMAAMPPSLSLRMISRITAWTPPPLPSSPP